MDITAIIQARLTSTRLPGKVLLPLGDKPLIWYVYKRTCMAGKIKKVVVATSSEKSDEPLVNYCLKENIPVLRGSMDDVLDRYYQVAKQINARHIARITADCPLIDHTILDAMANEYSRVSNDIDYLSNTHPPTFPDGMDCEIFSFNTLEKAWKSATLQSEREHVTPYMYNNPDKFNIQNFENDEDYSHIRLTVDEKEDYELVKRVYSHFDYRLDFDTHDIIAFLSKEKEFAKINNKFARNEGYLKSVRQDKKQQQKKRE